MWLKGKGGFPTIQGALLVVDADHFKRINDTHGHEKGDEALKIIADQVKAVVRHGDFVGRIGGEEFGVMLCGADFAVAELVAERIRQSIADAGFSVDGVVQDLSVSVGGVVFHTQTPFSTLFRKADNMLYVAKEAGRNQVRISRLMPQVAAA